MILTNKY